LDLTIKHGICIPGPEGMRGLSGDAAPIPKEATMRCYSTPEAPCQAVCDTCARSMAPEAWEGWSELDPAIQEGSEPIRCARCGESL